MKKLNITLLILVLISSKALACSFSPDPFCTTSFNNEDRNVLKGKIISIDEDGIELQVIEMLRGVETREIIRIWDGTDFDCNGPWSLAATALGQINDTIIAILPLIDSLENSWDVMGDYRMPDSYYWETTRLTIRNDSIRGYVTGYIWDFEYYTIPYSTFINYWNNNMNDCIGFVDTDDIVEVNSAIWYTNPVHSNCAIQFAKGNHYEKTFQVYSSAGKKVKTVVSRLDKATIDLSTVASGLYFIKISDEEGRQSVLKVVKN